MLGANGAILQITYACAEWSNAGKLYKNQIPGPESLSARLYAASAMSSAACLLVNCRGIWPSKQGQRELAISHPKITCSTVNSQVEA